jgi:hypothetical protein
MTTSTPARFGAAVALLVVAAAFGVAACGGSSSTSSGTATAASARAFGSATAAVSGCLETTGDPSTLAALVGCRGADVRSCLEKHGALPLSAGGSFPTFASRIKNPKFAAVLKDCGADVPHDLGFGQAFPTPAVRTLDAYVACVARSGYKLPMPNTSGKGPVFPAGTDRISKYRAAAENCVSIIESRTSGPTGTTRTGGAAG